MLVDTINSLVMTIRSLKADRNSDWNDHTYFEIPTLSELLSAIIVYRHYINAKSHGEREFINKFSICT
jgi:hypothetical protein